MKLSVLIQQLQALLEQYGDAPVWLDTDGCGYGSASATRHIFYDRGEVASHGDKVVIEG